MVWLDLLLALAAFAVALKSTSIALGVVCLLAALGFLVACVLGLLARRIGRQSRDESLILDPAELHRLREQAQARTAAANEGGEPPDACSARPCTASASTSTRSRTCALHAAGATATPSARPNHRR